MPSKREHTKSRLGCGQCKGRRIKCDEIAPRCGPCSKKGLECDYKALEGVQQSIQILTQASFASSSKAIEHGSPGRISHSSGSPRYSSSDLLLMHHYTIDTSYSLPSIPEDPSVDVWRARVPILAYQYPFLMHAVLSVSAAHKSLLDLSRHHYSKAIAAFGSSSEVATSEHADAVLCYSVLITIITIALECAHATPDADPLSGILDFFAVTRTAVPMLSAILPSVQSRPIGRLLGYLQEVPGNHALPHALNYSLTNLENLIEIDYQAVPEISMALRNVIHSLRYFFTLVLPQPLSRADLLRWVVAVSPEYIALLRNHDPAAMVILAHWCVPAANAPAKWYVEYWPRRVVLSIAQETAGSMWQSCMAWPLASIQQEQMPMWSTDAFDSGLDDQFSL